MIWSHYVSSWFDCLPKYDSFFLAIEKHLTNYSILLNTFISNHHYEEAKKRNNQNQNTILPYNENDHFFPSHLNVHVAIGQNLNCVFVYVGFYFDYVFFFCSLKIDILVAVLFLSFWNLSSQFCFVCQRRQNKLSQQLACFVFVC